MTETEQERARIVAWLRLCAKDDAPFGFTGKVDPRSGLAVVATLIEAGLDFTA